MNSQHFIAKQRIKYYWKTLKYTTQKTDSITDTDTDVAVKDSFWEYEKTPRTML